VIVVNVESIIDSFSAISVLLVFIIMLFTLRYPKIIADINKEIPRKEKIKEREREKRRLKSSFIINCMPQTVLLGITAYLFLPLSIYIIKNSQFSFWNFDFLITIFIFISGWIWSFFIWSLVLGLKILFKAFHINVNTQKSDNMFSYTSDPIENNQDVSL
jgi:flagellar biosynthesis protein FlhB